MGVIRINEGDAKYAEMVQMAKEAMADKGNLIVVARGLENRKEAIKPYCVIDDIAFYVAAKVPGVMGCTAFLNNVTVEDYQIAKKNTEENALFGNLMDLIGVGNVKDSMFCAIDEWKPARDEPFYVVANKEKCNGAGVLVCDSLLQKIREKIGDFYILPSSNHEILIVPTWVGIDLESLTQMVAAINGANVEPEDRLRDRAYLYNGALNTEGV